MSIIRQAFMEDLLASDTLNREKITLRGGTLLEGKDRASKSLIQKAPNDDGKRIPSPGSFGN